MRKQLRRKRERLYGTVEEKTEKIEDKTNAVVKKSKRGRKKKDE